MGEKYVLYFYSAAAFRQVVLPVINNADYIIRLSAEQFHFQKDAYLLLEVIENVWYLNWERDKHLLWSGELLKLQLPEGDTLSLITLIGTSIFCVSSKYWLPQESPLTIGSGASNVICYNAFQLISAFHAIIFLTEQGYCIEDKSKNGIYINGKRLDGKQILCFGDCIDLFGLRMVFLGNAVTIYHNAGELQGRIGLCPYIISYTPLQGVKQTKKGLFHRSPRKWKELGTDSMEIEPPAVKRELERQSLFLSLGPALTMILPLMISISINPKQGNSDHAYVYVGLFMTVVTVFMGILLEFFNRFFQSRERKWEEKRRKVVYKSYLKEVEEYIVKKHQNSCEILIERYPAYKPPVIWEEMLEGLWSRNSIQKDFLYQRLGIGEMSFPMEIKVPKQSITMFRDDLREEPGRLKREYERLKNVPVCIDLKQYRIIGIVGGQAKKGAIQIVVNLLVQIAVNNCYTDVKVAFLYNEQNTKIHELVNVIKWLPHIWEEKRGMRYLAGDRTEAGDVLYALGEICRKPMKRHYVLFVEDQSILDGEIFNRYIFSGEETLRLTTIFLEETIEDMPNECSYFIQNDQYFSGIVEGSEEKELIFDRIPLPYAEELTRKLIGIRVKENGNDGELKSYVPFLSLFSEKRIEDMDIAGQWLKNRINESIRVPIGRKAGNRILYLDIHEKYHGPHGLIAGTTGSGKSETLQTYLLSLAMHFSPEDVSFFIIDYKGGGMGNLFGELPHTVGTVSNLSGNQIQRALISIKSENQKRQRKFQAYGMNHINQYTAAYKNNKLDDCMPHLFIIVDEFAELKREEPEFMKELVSVAQVGRSLGVHLILATQKPAGVVDDNIWSNTRFRLCLRVQDRQDSMDMLHRPDAAGLTGAGRCYLQVGSDEVFELFQAAYSGAVYEEDREEIEKTAVIISRTGKNVLECDRLWIKKGDKEITQLEKIIDYLKELSRQAGYTKESNMWMNPLPERLKLEDMEPYGDQGQDIQGGLRLYACAGLCDNPGKQSQYPLYFDLCRQGNILICGGPATGKSTLLQTLLYSLMMNHSPRESEFYLIDCSSHMLGAFAEMPHVAGMAGEEPDKWERIFYRLRQELRKRKEQFSGGSFMHRQTAEERIPAIVLAIDNYGGFRVQTKEQYDAVILQLAAEGKNNGIYLMLTAAGIGMSEVPGKLAGNLGYRMALELGDTYQYGEVLRVGRPGVYPEGGKRGRGIVKEEEGVLEFQTALALGEENDFIRMDKIKKKSAEKREEYFPYRVKAIPEIPKTPDFASFYKEINKENFLKETEGIPIGYEEESGNIYWIYFKHIYCYLITGRKGSGKSNLLKMISHMTKGEKTVYINFSDENHFEGAEGIYSIQNDKQLYHWLEELSPVMQQRNQSIHAGDKRKYPPIFVLIDDLSDFCRHVYHPQGGVESMGAFVEHIWKKGNGHGVYWFAAWNPETEPGILAFPCCPVFIEYGKGLHLGGNTAMQRSFAFDDLSYGEQNKTLKPGIALIPPRENIGTVKVILPLVTEEIGKGNLD